jgi:hypothetical protein
MPANVVKTAEDERLWRKAKKQAKRQGHAADYPYIMGIFQRMKKSERENAPERLQAPQGLTLDLAKAEDLYDEQTSPEALSKATSSHWNTAAQRARPAYLRVPGAAAQLQRRGANPNVAPEEERYLRGLYTNMPTPKLRISEGNFNEPADVVKGLGFSPGDESIWTTRVRRWTNGARTDTDLRKAVYEDLRHERSIPNTTRAELVRRTFLLFKEQRRTSGDFVAKSGRGLLLKAKPPFGNGNRQSKRGQMPDEEQSGDPSQMPGRQNNRVDTHPGGKGKEKPMPQDNGDEEMNGKPNGGAAASEEHYEDPNLDTAPLEDEAEDPGVITAELEKLHKKLHELHQHLEHTPGEIHLHNELVQLMRDVYANPTPDGLRDVRHKLHHFAQLVQGPEDGMEPPDDPDGEPEPQMGDDGEEYEDEEEGEEDDEAAPDDDDADAEPPADNDAPEGKKRPPFGKR